AVRDRGALAVVQRREDPARRLGVVGAGCESRGTCRSDRRGAIEGGRVVRAGLGLHAPAPAAPPAPRGAPVSEPTSSSGANGAPFSRPPRSPPPTTRSSSRTPKRPGR